MPLRRGIFWSLALLGTLVVLAACGRAREPATPLAEPTEPPVAGGAADRPPDVDNDAPAGVCENTANLLSRVDRDEDSLFRALALDNRAGGNDGDGIAQVRFVVVGDDLTYEKVEETAPYCIFGGNEPNCPPWPRDGQGRYVWGAGGPVVLPGRYQVFVEVTGFQADSATGSEQCNWTFVMQVLE